MIPVAICVCLLALQVVSGQGSDICGKVTCGRLQEWLDTEDFSTFPMSKEAILYVLKRAPNDCEVDISESSCFKEIEPSEPVVVATEPPTPPPCPQADSSTAIPNNCADVQTYNNQYKNGVYKISPKPWYNEAPFDAYCDLQTDGGGWTVIQRRDNYALQENFNRPWLDYKQGFGDVTRDFWLGNDRLFAMTGETCTDIRFDMVDFEASTSGYAQYSNFQVLNENRNYKMTFDALSYVGDRGDSLRIHNGRDFATFDRDIGNNAVTYKGGFWFGGQPETNPNGMYLRGPFNPPYLPRDGVFWITWPKHNIRYSLKRMEMKIRPCYFRYASNTDNLISMRDGISFPNINMTTTDDSITTL